jgi:large subunit ribosomal protein L5
VATAEAKVQPRLKERYEREIKPALIERFGYSSSMQAPRLVKITVNMGVGDAKQDTNLLQAASEQLATIAGQRPNVRRARKSIANFKLREEMPVGVAVTLRDARMYEFLDRLMSIAIPRIRDFRGLNARSFDGRGNYNMGVREQIIFPEIDYDSVDQVRGLDISIATTAATDEEAFALLEAFGMPFQRAEQSAAQIRQEQTERESADEKAEKAAAEEAAREQLKEENPEAYATPTEAAGDVTPEGAARETGTGSEGAAPTVDEQQGS